MKLVQNDTQASTNTNSNKISIFNTTQNNTNKPKREIRIIKNNYYRKSPLKSKRLLGNLENILIGPIPKVRN